MHRCRAEQSGAGACRGDDGCLRLRSTAATAQAPHQGADVVSGCHGERADEGRQWCGGGGRSAAGCSAAVARPPSTLGGPKHCFAGNPWPPPCFLVQAFRSMGMRPDKAVWRILVLL